VSRTERALRSRRTACLALFAFGAAACGSSNLRPDQRPGTDQAVAFFLVRSQGSKKARFHFFPRDSFAHHTGYIDAQEGVHVYALALDPEPHRLREVSVSIIRSRLTKKDPCARLFAVKPGVSSYGGTLDLTVQQLGANVLGCDVDFSGYEDARAAYEAAFPKLARAFPVAPQTVVPGR
jgi:hypothetical protein